MCSRVLMCCCVCCICMMMIGKCICGVSVRFLVVICW